MSLKNLPLIIFAGLLMLFAIGLTLNPREVPSPLIGQTAPKLNDVQPLLLSDTHINDLQGKVWVLNVWASWCNSCAQEHPNLALLQNAPWRLVGLNYRDDAEDAKRWLNQKGNPYHLVLFDPEGMAAMNWGVTAAPETFIIDWQNKVRYRHTGPITPKIWQENLQPLLLKLQADAP